jgi:mono/diheme cytochrome c family protein
MKLFLKLLLAGIATVVALIIIALVGVSVLASRRLAQKHPIPEIAVLNIPSDSGSIARGEHLATAVSNCVECHGPDLGGSVFMDAGPIGVASAPNLTRGAGGIGAAFADLDWIRAIKYGIRADSTSLLIMPSETFAYLSDTDLGALIAYLKQLPPVDRQVSPTHLRMLGRIMLATGAMPLLVADKTPRPVVTAVTPGVTVEYGRYLADISGCRGCHGLTLSGGEVAGPPGIPLASNLTPAGPIAQWSEEDFLRVFREGKRPDGTTINEFMPWKVMGRMTDDELRAILTYVRSVPPLATGNK